MSPLFTAIVVILALLAVMGIVVGGAHHPRHIIKNAHGGKIAPPPGLHMVGPCFWA